MELAELVDLAKECKGPGAFQPATLIRIGGILASKINAVENLSGSEKLKLVQRILLQLLAEAENKEIAEPNLTKEHIQKIHAQYDLLEAVVSDAVPASLELAIQAARGRLDLKKIKPSSWVKACSCFASTVVHQLASLKLISEVHANQARQVLVTVTEKATEVAVSQEETSLPKSESQEEKKETETSPAAPVEGGTSQ